MSPLKVLFAALHSLLSRLLCTPQLWLRTSQIVPYILSMKEKGKYGITFKTFKCLLYVYLLTLAFRTVIINVHLFNDADALTGHLTVDPLLSLAAHHMSILNKYTFALVGLFALFSLYLDVTYFLLTDVSYFKIDQVILIENVAQASTARHGPVGAPPHHSLSHWVRSIREINQWQSRDEHSHKGVSFGGKRLKAFPHLSMKHRVHLLLMALYSETAIWAANLIAGIFFLLIWYVIFQLMPSIPLVIIDLSLLVYSIFNTFRVFLFSFHTIFFLRCLFVGHLKDLHAYLRAANESGTKATNLVRERAAMVCFIGHLAFFQRQHTAIYLLGEKLNRETVSRLVGVSVVINFLINVVLLNFLLISRTTPFEMILVLIVIYLQTVLGLFATQTLISMVAPLYTSERTLYRAQAHLRCCSTFKGLFERQVVSAKLRLMTLFELICTKKKFAFTVGVSAKLTKKAVFEFFFFYSGFFLYIAKLLKKYQIGR